MVTDPVSPGGRSTLIPRASMEKLCAETPLFGKLTVTSVFAGIVTCFGSK